MAERYQVTFKTGEGSLVTLVEALLGEKFIDVHQRGTHIAAFVASRTTADEACRLRDHWREKTKTGQVIPCDAPDCPEIATNRAFLAKSGQKIYLCQFHTTRFALRGLLRTTEGLIPSIDIREVYYGEQKPQGTEAAEGRPREGEGNGGRPA